MNNQIPYTRLYASPANEKLRQAAVEAMHEVSPEIHAFEGRVKFYKNLRQINMMGMTICCKIR